MATGSPPPRITWQIVTGTPEGVPALPIAGLRHTHPNGSLEMLAFPMELYRSDVHAVKYRCRASNQVGAIISKDVHVHGVVKQDYDVQVYDEHVVAGNTATLKCQVPPYVAEYIMVTSWEVDQVSLYPSSDVGGKHVVMANGDLYIQDVTMADRHREYTCRTLHRLTGQTRSNRVPGRIIVTEPKGSAQLRLNVEKHQRLVGKVGEEVVLPCLAQGHPVPTSKWTREKEPGKPPKNLSVMELVQPDDRVNILAGAMRLKKARLMDTGMYVCGVANSAAEDYTVITLQVTAPLTVHVSPPWQEVSTGSEATLECSLAGTPVYDVKWLRDAVPVQAGPRVSIFTPPVEAAVGPGAVIGPRVSRLKISAVNKEDRGMYQCVASNDHDMAQGTSELKLGDAVPELVYSFSEQTLQPGPAVSLKCMAVGIPPPQFSWTLDGFPLPESQRFLVGQYVTIHDDVISHVNITGVREEDGGEYTCTARNSVGFKAHSARVNVYGKPYIREMPRITAVAGKDLVIKCPAAGYPIETITWEHDGAMLPVTRRQKVFGNGTLVIQQARQSEDQGTYTCQAVNRQKHTARRDVEVSVQIPPRIMPILPLNLSEGMRAAIGCQILEGDQPVSFRWERDGRPLRMQAQDGAYTRRHDEFSSVLVIERVAAKHSANYTCVASNVAGPDRFTVPLIVNVPPRWLVEPSDTSASAGQDVWLHCSAEGSPPPSVLWKKAVGSLPGEYRDLALFDHHVNLMPNGTLHFVRISKESEGHYMCEAGNSVGSDVSKVVFLKINAPAHFASKWRQVQVEVAKGEAARLQCASTGDTPIDIQWRQAGQRLAVDTDHRLTLREHPMDGHGGQVSELTIERTTRHDSATFTCSATNAYGQDEMTIQLVVQGARDAAERARDGAAEPQRAAGMAAAVLRQLAHLRLHPAVQAGLRTLADEPHAHDGVRDAGERHAGRAQPRRVVPRPHPGREPPGPERAVRGHPGHHTGGGAQRAATGRAGRGALQHRAGGDMGAAAQGTLARLAARLLRRLHASDRHGVHGHGPAHPRPVHAQDRGGGLPVRRGGVAHRAGQVHRVQRDSAGVQQQRGGADIGTSHCPHHGGRAVDATGEPQLQADVGAGAPSELAAPAGGGPQRGDTGLQGALPAHGGVVRQGQPRREGDLVDVHHAAGPAQLHQLQHRGAGFHGLRRRRAYVAHLLPNGRGRTVRAGRHQGVDGVPQHGAGGLAAAEPPQRRPHGLQLLLERDPRRRQGEHDALHAARRRHRDPRGAAPVAQLHVQVLGDGEHARRRGRAQQGGHRQAQRQSAGPHRVLLQDAHLALEAQRVPGLLARRLPRAHRVLEVQRQAAGPGRHQDSGERERPAGEGCAALGPGQLQLRRGEPPRQGRDHLLPCRESPSRAADTVHPDVRRRQPAPALGGQRTRGPCPGLRHQLQARSRRLGGAAAGVQDRQLRAAQLAVRQPVPAVHDGLQPHRHGAALRHRAHRHARISARDAEPGRAADGQLDGGDAVAGRVGGRRLPHPVPDRGVPRGGGRPLAPRVQPRAARRARALRGRPHARLALPTARHGAQQRRLRRGRLQLHHPVAGRRPDPAAARRGLPLADGRPRRLRLQLPGDAARGAVHGHRGGAGLRGDAHRQANLAQLQNQQNRDQHYLALPAPKYSETSTYKTVESSDYIKDICPYATFQLNATGPTSKTYSDAGSTCSFSGNIYSGPYHSVRGSFVYHDGTDTYKLRHQKEPEYTKVRRKKSKLRDPHSESQESDNLGSTDSEVKKILSLHLPISEYDTLGSDTEGSSQQQEMASFRHRVPRGARTPRGSVVPCKESTSSSETSPVDPRKQGKQFQPRKSKSKGQLSGKRHVRSSSGYSSHTEETTFSFSDRIQPPSRFSDSRSHSHSRDLSETEKDVEPKRRSSRSSVPSRAARDGIRDPAAAFQIDV